jgi:hypothetical protein
VTKVTGMQLSDDGAIEMVRPRRWRAGVALIAGAGWLGIAAGCGDDKPASPPPATACSGNDGGTLADASAPPAGGVPRLIVPAYVYPGAEWDRLIAAAPTVGILIANPADGPGGTADPVYQDAIGRAQQAGIAVLGYVATAYGQRPSADVLSDINGYYDLYQPSGIFLSEGPMDADCVGMEAKFLAYASAARARDPKAFVAVGTRYCPAYIYFSDLIVLFARQETEYQTFQPANWMPSRSADRFAHLVSEVPGQAMEATLARARALGAGWLYVTDDLLPNPWDSLPSYFDREVEIASTFR